MDSRLLMVKAITLVFREREEENNAYDSDSLIKDAVAIINKSPESAAMADFVGKDPLVELRSTLNRILSHKSVGVIDRNELMQRLLLNTEGDNILYQALKDGIEPVLDHDQRASLCKSIRYEIRSFIDESRAMDLIKASYHMLKFNQGKIDTSELISEIVNKLEVYKNIGASDISKSKGFSEVDIDNEDSVVDIFDSIKNIASGEDGLQFGMQDLNAMAGPTRKFSRGETIFIPAPSYSFKTGTIKALVRQLAMHNVPVLTDPAKIPLIVCWSVENENRNILKSVYVAIYHLLYNEEPDLTNISNSEISGFLKTHLQRNGYRVKFIRTDPAITDYAMIMNQCDKWKEEGFEIHALALDYLEKCSTKGCIQGAIGADVKDLLSRLRNYFAVENILFMTPHQLNGEARAMRDSGDKNVIRKFGGSGVLYAKAKDLYQEIDIEIVVNKFDLNTMPFLEYYLGKNRNNPDILEGRKYVCYPLCPFTGLRDDIDSRNTGIRQRPNAASLMNSFSGDIDIAA